MWNKKTSEEPEEPRMPEAPPVPTPRPKAPPPANLFPSTGPPGGTAVIGKEMRVRGEIRSNEDLWVDGNVEGTLELAEHRLTVGPHGVVKADIRAREVVVMGNVQGNVEALDKVTIRKDASLVGDLRMAGVQIDDGAYFKGSIDIVRPETKAPVREPVMPPPRPAAQNDEPPALKHNVARK